MEVGSVVDAQRRVIDVPVRDLRNRTRDVMLLVEQGWTVYLTNHGRRFASLNPVADAHVAPRLAGLLAALDATDADQSGIGAFVAAARQTDRHADPVPDPWR